MRRSSSIRAIHSATAPNPASCVARLLACGDEGPVIESDQGPRRTRATVELRRLHQAVGGEVLVVFAGEARDQPVITGIIAPPQNEMPAVEAEVDGERVVIRGSREIVLECGEASITLRANGRVVVRGTYVETRAQGVNRIRGGSVKIN